MPGLFHPAFSASLSKPSKNCNVAPGETRRRAISSRWFSFLVRALLALLPLFFLFACLPFHKTKKSPRWNGAKRLTEQFWNGIRTIEIRNGLNGEKASGAGSDSCHKGRGRYSTRGLLLGLCCDSKKKKNKKDIGEGDSKRLFPLYSARASKSPIWRRVAGRLQTYRRRQQVSRANGTQVQLVASSGCPLTSLRVPTGKPPQLRTHPSFRFSSIHFHDFPHWHI